MSAKEGGAGGCLGPGLMVVFVVGFIATRFMDRDLGFVLWCFGLAAVGAVIMFVVWLFGLVFGGSESKEG